MQDPQHTGDRRTLSDTGWLAVWTLAWVLTLAVAQFGPELWWGSSPVLGWVAIIVNLLAGAGWIIAHARFLRGVDDLWRKILMDAMAIALGVVLVGGCAFAAARSAGLVAFDVDIALLSIVMAVVYLIAIAVGSMRYR
ncbi:hypothetical protein ABZ477_06655 [Microbacterium sp. NPDC019599]|uniref:hypothetical protein n=1 Tax=Microbacterium sp. NPDC019599 TaxID=3154690 RepID=UPI0033F9A6B2